MTIDTLDPQGTSAATPDPTPTDPSSPPASVFNADGTFTENWFTHFGDEFSPHAETASRFKNPGDLLKSYIHLRSHGATYPDETATPDQIDRFRTLAKVPSTPEGYNLSLPESLPEGIALDEESVNEFKKIAHAHHVPAPALQAMMAKEIEILSARAQEIEAAKVKQMEESKSALIAEWKGDFATNSSVVRHITSRLGEAAGLEEADVVQLANNPAFARLMFQVSKLTREDSITAPSGLGDLRSPAEKANSIIGGKDAQWSERYQNGDPEAYKLVSRLLSEAKK